MSTHVRKQIRDAIKAALLADAGVSALVGTRVYANRTAQIRALPAVCIYGLEEKAELREASTLTYDRELLLAVELAAQATDGLDDDLDALALEVERIMKATPSWGGLADETFCAGMETDLGDRGETPVGLMRLKYAVLYLA